MDCDKILCDRLKDAENALKSGYSEQAEFDAALISVVLGLCKKNEPPKVNGSENAQAASETDIFNMAVNKMKDAENYYSLYQKSKDSRFLTIARQDLGHSAALSAILQEQGNTKDASLLDTKRGQLDRVIR